MAKPTPARTGNFYTRAQTARLLNNALGDYDWHKDLTRTTERTKDYRGYRGAGILLLPACTLGQQPHYEDAEIAAHVAAMQAAFPYLKSGAIIPKTLALPCIDKRLGWGRHGFRLNRAKKA